MFCDIVPLQILASGPENALIFSLLPCYFTQFKHGLKIKEESTWVFIKVNRWSHYKVMNSSEQFNIQLYATKFCQHY